MASRTHASARARAQSRRQASSAHHCAKLVNNNAEMTIVPLPGGPKHCIACCIKSDRPKLRGIEPMSAEITPMWSTVHQMWATLRQIRPNLAGRPVELTSKMRTIWVRTGGAWAAHEWPNIATVMATNLHATRLDNQLPCFRGAGKAGHTFGRRWSRSTDRQVNIALENNAARATPSHLTLTFCTLR